MYVGGVSLIKNITDSLSVFEKGKDMNDIKKLTFSVV